MSPLDEAFAAVAPPESQEAREKARANANAAAKPGGRLSLVLDHHLIVEAAFAKINSAPQAGSRTVALNNLDVALTGHVIAEEEGTWFPKHKSKVLLSQTPLIREALLILEART